jgi:hypothetical protein
MWTRPSVLSKLRATAFHLGLSAIAFGVVLYFIVVEWYPQPWFTLDGGWQGVRIMIFVDLVLGPSLTFLVFDLTKTRRALLFDFSLIGLVQAGAFVWGVVAVHGQRPAALSYWDGGFWDPAFYSVEQKSLREQGRSPADLAAFDHRRPPLVYSEQPTERKESMRVAQRAKTERLMEYEQFDLLRPLKPNLDKVFAGSALLGAALARLPEGEAAIRRVLESRPQLKREDLRFVVFDGRYKTVTLIFDREGEIVGFGPYVDADATVGKVPEDKK